VEFFLHIDKYLNIIIQDFGVWSYAILFAIIFAETGLVITPFLPGDSLLFAAGTLAAIGSFNVFWLFLVLVLAAVIGDSVNYACGKIIGVKAFEKKNSRIFKKEYLERTHKFYEKYGGKTIVIARFMPIVRTFAPFVAGVAKMNYYYFIFYNIAGALLWVSIFVFGGYWFGNMPVFKSNFSLAIMVIIILSILPAAFEFWRHRSHRGVK
jgi:membrane-associated protein